MLSREPLQPDTLRQLCCPVIKPSPGEGCEALIPPRAATDEIKAHLVNESFPLTAYVPPEEDTTNRPLLRYEQVILETLSASFEALKRDLPEEVYRVVFELALATYMHALPNAIDALYEAVDRQALDSDDAMIDLRLTFLEDSNAKIVIEITDNGLGIPTAKLQSFKMGWFNSSKVPGGRNLGQAGFGLSELLRMCSSVACLEIISSHDGHANRFIAEPYAHTKDARLVRLHKDLISLDEVPEAGPRRGTVLRMTFYPSCSLAEQLRGLCLRDTGETPQR